jgi:hypothetical protein
MNMEDSLGIPSTYVVYMGTGFLLRFLYRILELEYFSRFLMQGEVQFVFRV